MNRFWDSVLRLVVEAVGARQIVEVGVDHGALTEKLLGWAAEHGAVIHAVDPHHAVDRPAWEAEYGDRLVFHESRSLNVLGRIEGPDVILIDGDHNWYTVINELRLLERTAVHAERLPPVVALHDVDWPYGRRDLYYDPDSIPAAHRQPFERKGIMPGEGELVAGGLNDHLQNAIYEHAIHNGVMTAVEDFIEESELPWRRVHIPGLRGLAILATEDRIAAHAALRPLLDRLGTPDFLYEWTHRVDLDAVKALIQVAQRERAVSEATEQITQLEGQLATGREERNELERRGDDHQATLDRASGDLSRTVHERDEANERAAQAGVARDAVVVERDALLVERDALAGERDALAGERDALAGERDALVVEREMLAGERDAVAAERDAVAGERDAVASERDAMVSSRDAVATEREALALERDALRAERENALAERDQALAERDQALAERDQALAARDQALAERDQALAEHRNALAERDQALTEHDRLDRDHAEQISRRRELREELGGEIERLEQRLAAAASLEAELRAELVAAHTRAEEADEQRRAGLNRRAGVGAGAESPTEIVWSQLGGALHAGIADIGTAVAPTRRE